MRVRSGDHLELPFLKISTKLNLRRSNGPLIWTMGRFISSLTVKIIYSKNSLFFGELCFSRQQSKDENFVFNTVFLRAVKTQTKKFKENESGPLFQKKGYSQI